jgi:hypothetical protein
MKKTEPPTQDSIMDEKDKTPNTRLNYGWKKQIPQHKTQLWMKKPAKKSVQHLIVDE